MFSFHSKDWQTRNQKKKIELNQNKRMSKETRVV